MCDAVLAVSFGDDLFLPLMTGADFNAPSDIPLVSGDQMQITDIDVDGQNIGSGGKRLYSDYRWTLFLSDLFG